MGCHDPPKNLRAVFESVVHQSARRYFVLKNETSEIDSEPFETSHESEAPEMSVCS